jgi:Ca2+-binding EF-hand superfamily protein|tara:strand:+ start:649 stop:870 length:222 start_codon:yes stop_codon:yes gene_type:complete
LLDTNKDGVISLDDFDDLFNSHGGAKMDSDIWNNLLNEADKNHDGVVSYSEFKESMATLLKKGLNKKRRNLDI